MNDEQNGADYGVVTAVAFGRGMRYRVTMHVSLQSTFAMTLQRWWVVDKGFCIDFCILLMRVLRYSLCESQSTFG
jgi:hypothetical protein